MNLKEKFTEVYRINEWGCKESRSGGGSTIERTEYIRRWLLLMIEEYKITSMLDCPCGDFHWMRLVKFPKNFIYIGADIVDEIIQVNQKKHKRALCNFLIRDLTSDPLPKMDLIFCKDLFLHLSFKDIWKVLRNFKESGAEYFIVSNYISNEKNKDQKTGGGWRPVNLQTEPFNFPPAIESLDTKDAPMTLFSMDQVPTL